MLGMASITAEVNVTGELGENKKSVDASVASVCSHFLITRFQVVDATAQL